jgi:aspartokinase
MKFGGSLLASRGGMRRVGDLVVASHERGDGVVAVVSALGDVTDLLLQAASASPFAALARLKLPRAARVVCIATGNGLKDLADHGGGQNIEPTVGTDSIERAIDLGP